MLEWKGRAFDEETVVHDVLDQRVPRQERLQHLDRGFRHAHHKRVLSEHGQLK